jgi:hypothetical protein
LGQDESIEGFIAGIRAKRSERRRLLPAWRWKVSTRIRLEAGTSDFIRSGKDSYAELLLATRKLSARGADTELQIFSDSTTRCG